MRARGDRLGAVIVSRYQMVRGWPAESRPRTGNDSMNQPEIDTWAAAATVEQSEAVRSAVRQAATVWAERIGEPVELHDLAAHSVTGMVWQSVAARAAAAAAAELAIVVSIWPCSPAFAFGRSCGGLPTR